jgi:hypothetical protein
MRFRTGLLLGIGIGYLIGQRQAEKAGGDAPLSPGARLVDDAAKAGLRAFQKARETIQGRLEADADAAWN